MERTHTTRDAFWDAWEQHLDNTQDPSETTIDALIIAAEVIARWIETAPEMEHYGEIILEYMSKFIDELPRVIVKH